MGSIKYNKEEVVKRLTEQLDGCLECVNAEIYDYSDKVLEVDLEKQTITIKLNYHVVEEDDYVGFGSY